MLTSPIEDLDQVKEVHDRLQLWADQLVKEGYSPSVIIDAMAVASVTGLVKMIGPASSIDHLRAWVERAALDRQQ